MTTPEDVELTPPARELLTRLSAAGDVFAKRFIDRMRAEIPAYAQLEPTALVPATQNALATVFRALEEGRLFKDTELTAFADHGELRARQGLSLDEVFAGWHVASRMMLDDLVANGRAQGVDDRALLDLSHAVLRTVDTAMLASASGHHNAEFEIARLQQNHRADLVRGVLFGTIAPASIRMQIEGYGLDYDREYYAIRARPSTTMPVRELERALNLTGAGGRPRGLAALVDGDLAGFLDQAPSREIAVAVGLGAAARPDRLEGSFRAATRAMTTAIAFGLDGTYDVRRLGLLPAVLADTEIGDELVARYLTPLGSGAAADALIETVRRFLASDMRIDRTAEQLVVHPNTVRYRLGRFESLTGAQLRDTNTTLEVWWALQRAQLDA